MGLGLHNRALWLSYCFTVGYNVIEGIVSILAELLAGIIAIVSIIVMPVLSVYLAGGSLGALETKDRNEQLFDSNITGKKTDTCTERCHVNYLAYENQFEVSQRTEVFRHRTHSREQGLACEACHDKSEVNTQGHGKLIIDKGNCLKCHHVELKEPACGRCHNDIDEHPMKYKEERFVHGFTVKSGVDCDLCHIKDPNASIKNEDINCVKCHHTTPDLDCVKCHKSDIDRYFDSDQERKNTLSWTVSFRHAQHPEHDITCKQCHRISHENEAGIIQYNLNCSKCHHDSDEIPGCGECHKEPSGYFKGDIKIEGVASAPDMMSRAVKCEDCHKYNKEELKFREVREYCIKCHNEDYGKLHDAWTHTIKDRLREFNLRIQSLGEDGHLLYKDEPDVEGDKKEKAGDQSDLDTFIEETGEMVNFITKYGTHNFNLTRMILNRLEEKIMLYHEEALNITDK